MKNKFQIGIGLVAFNMKLSEIIQSCLDDDVENPVLERRINKWF